MGNYELSLEEPFFEVPDPTDAAFADGCNDKLCQAEESSRDIFFSYIINISHNIFSRLYLFKMVGIIMNFDPPVPPSRNKQFMHVVIHKDGDFLFVWRIGIDEEPRKEVDGYDFSFDGSDEALPFPIIELNDGNIWFNNILIVFSHNSFRNRPYLKILPRTNIDL